MITAQAALDRLIQGNARFVAGDSEVNTDSVSAQRAANQTGQKPFAVFLSCADSRVPVEHIFDQGLGDVFVIRVAGNIATPSQIGSIEYAVDVLGAHLVVVLGHSSCGAVAASLEVMQSQQAVGGHIDSIVECITPALTADMDLDTAVKSNVLHHRDLIGESSPQLAKKMGAGALKVVGAHYDLPSGKVTFYP